jgi:hypothetical protein
MPARLSRHALVAGVASCALALATAAPGIARPGGHPPAASPHAGIAAPDDGATTLAVVLIAGGALFAGAGAGFAGGRRVALRLH